MSKNANKMAELERRILEQPILTELKDKLKELYEGDDGILKVELTICCGFSGEGRGNTSIHIILPCDNRLCEEF